MQNTRTDSRLGCLTVIVFFFLTVGLLSVIAHECQACTDGGQIIPEIEDCEVTYYPSVGYYVDGRFINCEGYSIDDCYVAAVEACVPTEPDADPTEPDAGPEIEDVGPGPDTTIEEEEVITLYSDYQEPRGCSTLGTGEVVTGLASGALIAFAFFLLHVLGSMRGKDR